jgi:hypothetical protein
MRPRPELLLWKGSTQAVTAAMRDKEHSPDWRAGSRVCLEATARREPSSGPWLIRYSSERSPRLGPTSGGWWESEAPPRDHQPDADEREPERQGIVKQESHAGNDDDEYEDRFEHTLCRQEPFVPRSLLAFLAARDPPLMGRRSGFGGLAHRLRACAVAAGRDVFAEP